MNTGNQTSPLQIFRLQDMHFEDHTLLDFLKTYQAENFYLHQYKIDQNAFFEFKLKAIRRYVNAGKLIWAVQDSQQNWKAIFGILKNDSRSQGFGFPYYVMHPYYNFTPSAEACFQLFWETLKRDKIYKVIQYLKVKVDASDHYGVAALAASKGRFLGTSQNLLLKKENYGFPKLNLQNWTIDPMHPNELPIVKQLIEQHRKNEDFYDVAISESATQNNFMLWFENYQKGNSSNILVLKEKGKTDILGFTCYTSGLGFSRIFNLQLITRDLTIVSKEHMGKGLGSLLFQAVMEREHKNVELKLLGNNYSALRFNQKQGFKIISSHHYFRFSPK